MVGRRDHDPVDRSILDFSDGTSNFVEVSAGIAPAFQPSATAFSDQGKNTSSPAANQEEENNERNAISNLLAQLARSSNVQQHDMSSANIAPTSNSAQTATPAPDTSAPILSSSYSPSGQDLLQLAQNFVKETTMNPTQPLPLLDNQTWDNIDPAHNDIFHAAPLQEENTLEAPFPPFQPPITGDSVYNLKSSSSLEHGPLRDEDLPEKIDQSATRGQVEAYAKLEFPDGVYYITTHSCELGRDVRMYDSAKRKKAASLRRSHGAKSGASSDKVSRPSKRSRKEGGSLVKRSVVSDKGGFCGMDDSGPEEDLRPNRKETAKQTHSSQPSEASIVKPQDLDLNVPLPSFDYQHYALELVPDDTMFEDDEKPAPVTAEHLPKPKNSNPLVPIHHMTADTVDQELKDHTSISRRHIRICWDYKHDCWKAHVMGRNGAFVDGKYVPKGSVGSLGQGSKIQIASVEATFKLPQTMVEDTTDESEAEEDVSPSMNKQSATPPSEEGAMSMSPSKAVARQTKIYIKGIKKPILPQPAVSLNADGQPVPPKKRGPGRPPKDGVSSNREKREAAKKQKAAEAKAANGGVTPPPTGRAKPSRPVVQAEVTDPTKPEKRKYTKRKRAETDDILPSIEGEDGDAAAGTDEDARATRKARPSRSRSPDYPPKESWTEDQLAKPPDNYARLIYDILNDIWPKELGLRQIYRELKKKWPYFVHVVQTEGWQSSVRHNLNSEHEKLFEKGQKDGKGWAWKAIKGAMEPKEELEKKKRAVAAAAAAKANANTMPNGPRYPPQGPPRPGQQWQQPPGQMFMYPGMPPNGAGFAPPQFYAPPMPSHSGPWPQSYAQGPPPSPGQTQNLSMRSGSGPPLPFPPNQPGSAWPYSTTRHGQQDMPRGFEHSMPRPPSNQHFQHQNPLSSGSPNVERLPSAGAIHPKAEEVTSPWSAQGIEILGKFIIEFVGDFTEEEKVRGREVFEMTKKVVRYGDPEPVFTSVFDKGVFAVMLKFARDIARDYPNPDYLRRSAESGGAQPEVKAKENDQAKTGDGAANKDVEMEEGKEKEQNVDGDTKMPDKEAVSEEVREGSETEVGEAPDG